MPRFIKKPLASIVGLLINWAFKQSTVVAAMSQYSAQQAKRAGAKNVVVVPGGVDVSNVINLKPVKKPQKLKLITTSTLIPRNGIDVLVEACTLLPADIDWELKIAGDGPMREKIENSIRSKGLNKRVKIIGMVQSNRVVDLLDQSYLFARPSRAEGFGVSFIEAMSRGVPIIGTLVGGIPDFLKHKKTGVSVPVDDPQALADAIILLWKSKKLYDRIRKNAWLLVKNRYNWTRIGKEFYHSFQMTVAPND